VRVVDLRVTSALGNRLGNGLEHCGVPAITPNLGTVHV
jgi:hypothetical protein